MTLRGEFAFTWEIKADAYLVPLQLNLLQRSIIAIQKHIFNLVDQIQWADKGYFFKDITNFPSCNKSLLLSECLVTLSCVYLNVQYTHMYYFWKTISVSNIILNIYKKIKHNLWTVPLFQKNVSIMINIFVSMCTELTNLEQLDRNT